MPVSSSVSAIEFLKLLYNAYVLNKLEYAPLV